MDVRLLASIIQGEAGGMGPAGMMFVALCLSCRINQHGHSEDRTALEWCGRAEPGETARLLAQLVIENRLPACDYLYCMGGVVDVERFGWKDGDAIVKVGEDSIHLYREWPEKKEAE